MKKTYFISDLHLGAPYFADSKESEMRVVRFLDSIKEDAESLYMLGDVLDYWYEYRYVVPKGYVRFFGKLAELADSGVKIVWLIGNHDIWLFDYLPSEIGLEVADGPILREIGGEKFLLSHGDGLGKTPLTFRILRSFFRNRFCQWLYSGIHPRWTVPFAENWSRSSRAKGSAALKVNTGGPKNHLKEYSEEMAAKDPSIRHFIYGHLHIVVQEKLAGGADMTILGDWISQFTFATFTPGEGVKLHKYEE